MVVALVEKLRRQTLPIAQQSNCEACRHRYEDQDRKGLYQTQLTGRQQKPGENIQEFEAEFDALSIWPTQQGIVPIRMVQLKAEGSNSRQ